MKIPGPHSRISKLEALKRESGDLEFRKLPSLVMHSQVWKPLFEDFDFKISGVWT